MTERLIDAVCPHCGRVGTTVRVVLHEDGYTKLSRRCTDCGGECIHTFDHDWLSVAKNKKLQADNERLTNAVALVSERVRQLSEERDYAWGEVEKLRADLLTQHGCCDGAAAQDAHIRREREEHRAEVEKLRSEIERMREALSWYADKHNHFPVEHRRPGDPDPAVVFVEEPPIMSDGGKRARKALWGKP